MNEPNTEWTNLREFTKKWNSEHPKFTFDLQMGESSGRPLVIWIRYSASKYRDSCSLSAFVKLRDMVKTKSRGLCVVTSNEEAFAGGIIDLGVASQNHNYQDRLIVGTLWWIGAEFFPQLARGTTMAGDDQTMA